MPDNSEEEHLSFPTNRAETASGEIISDIKPQPINPNQKSESMEVHHHPDLHHKPKKWKEYFLEFLMIFLAVTLGFFAESFREHIVNKEREKQYIQSFYEDLINDQKNLVVLINSIQRQQVQPGESLPFLFEKASTSTPADSIYYFLRKFIRQQGIKAFITDRTFEQIKNAGEMRLITKKNVADSLINYYKEIVMIDYLQQTLLGLKAKLIDNIPLILKSSDYRTVINSSDVVIMPTNHVYLLTTDPLVVNKVLIQVEDIRALSNTIKSEIQGLLEENSEIERLILAEYKIEN
jgi:hypothetical protein